MKNKQNKQKQPKPEPVDDSETTENEFSELETKKETKTKGNQPDIRQKIKESLEKEEEDSARFPRPSMTRNVPIDIKYKNLKVRTFWTIIMLVSFIGIVAAGHFYCAMLVLVLNTGMVKEILSLKRNKERDNEVQFSLSLNWYFYAVAVFYFYGKAFSSNLTRFSSTSKAVEFLINYHEITSFILWIAGFLMFTLSLKKGYLRYQFRQFGWTHLCLMLIMGQGVSMVSNIYEGIIWFLLPCLLVISNDTFAYLFGIVFGKTQLIALSPKKTLEGFIGGMISTLAFAFIFSRTLSNFEYMICPQRELTLKPFEFISCTPPMVFQFFDYTLPLIGLTIKLSEFQIHALILACFTSLVSPFGGFFASGFKRAIKIKDFADVIPGHGGITDRMDCQVLTGAFVYMYVRQIVNGGINYVNGVTRFIVGEMDSTNQLLIFRALEKMLIGRGLLNATAV